MNEFIFIALIFALAFIFTGEPDLWDKWHAEVMRPSACQKL